MNSSPQKKTTRQDPSSDQRVVLVSPPSPSGGKGADVAASAGMRKRESFWAGAAAWSAVLFALIAGVSLLGWVYWTGDDRLGSTFFLRLLRRSDKPEVVVQPAVPEHRRVIDGRVVAEGAEDPGYYAVMVENMADGRPLAGLARAAVVYEAPVEGGITRFLAVYPVGEEVGRIGPVRSARPYYLDWTQEFDGLYVHVGGSPESLELIKTVRVRDLNQFYGGKFFWRDSARRAPHNVYTSTALLAGAVEANFADYKIRPLSGWRFKEDAGPEERSAVTADLVIDFSTPTYRVTWKYDRENNEYRRWQNEDEQRDEDGEPIRAKNVVVQYSEIRILDEIGRRRVKTAGEGRALLALDGRIFTAVWKKPSVQERTRYFDESGAEIAFNVGRTWVEVVPAGADISH